MGSLTRAWSWSVGAVFLMSLFGSSLLVGAQDSITHPIEVRALRAIKRTLIDTNKNLSNWNRGDPCTFNWTGVLCFNTTQDDGYLHVRELQLLDMNLTGTLSPELGRLSRLIILDFMWNGISGSIPKEIGNITSLELLLLNGNHLTGPLPEELGNLPNLDRIQIDQNNISGPIPGSFANLNKTKHFHMNNNSISGQIPPELARLPYLVHFLLDNNNLSGYLPPELSRMPNLTILQLDNNNFDGTIIPDSYGNMSNLLKLSLRNCNLQGPIPDLSRIPHLSYLDLSSNWVNGTIPTNQLSQDITTIDLSNNELTGSIPANFSALPNLQELLLANNSLNGSVSSSLWPNKTLNARESLILDLENNMLTIIPGNINLPPNVTLWLKGNPVCINDNINLPQLCASRSDYLTRSQSTTNSTADCSPLSCPFPFEYSSTSNLPCFCAAPLLVGYRLKSPGFSDFLPYISRFEEYLTSGLDLDSDQLYIDSFAWEKGPRLKMYLKLYPDYNANGSGEFNGSEVLRIRSMFTGWLIPDSDKFGPYELLNFTLLDIYRDDFMPPPGTSKRKNQTALIVGVLIPVGAMILILIYVIVHFKRRKEYDEEVLLAIGPRPNTFSYAELKAATEDFSPSNKLGEGGFGAVYKGSFPDGRVVAVKQLSIASHQGKSQFIAEVATISAVQHRNLVKLHGCCIEGKRHLLVYEYLENKSLDQALFGCSDLHLDWQTRFNICLATARGLAYLHEGSRPRIVHRDVKASNILLDAELCPKISDFGLAKLYDDTKTHISTRVAGTFGYLAPEYAMRGHLTEKADVYGFGIVALEILSGRPNSDNRLEDEKIYLLEWAWALHENDQSLDLVDPSLVEFDENEALRVVGVALLCTQESPTMRQPMSRVVAMLAGDIEVSGIITRPSYLTDLDFKDLTGSFATEDTQTSTASQNNDSNSQNRIRQPILSPVNDTEFSDIIEGR